MAQLDDVQPQKGERRPRTRSSRTPSSRTSATNRRRGYCAPPRRSSATANDGSKSSREHNIKVELGVPAESWSPPADVREELENRAARNVPIGNQASEPVEEPDRAEGAADRSSPYHKVGDGTPGDDDPDDQGGR